MYIARRIPEDKGYRRMITFVSTLLILYTPFVYAARAADCSASKKSKFQSMERSTST